MNPTNAEIFIVHMKVVENCAFKEIGKMLNMDPSEVRQKYYDAIMNLARDLRRRP